MPSSNHDLTSCLDDVWHFGRARHATCNLPIIDHSSPPAHHAAGSHQFLHPLFCLFDTDADGHVTLDEMRSLPCKLQTNDVSHSCAAALVDAATRSASETFDFPEFAALYESVLTEVQAEEDDDVVVEAFHVYDRNGDGFISASELATVLTEIGLIAATSDAAGEDKVEKCQAFIDRVDSDGNGLVDLHEFKAMLAAGNHFPSSSVPCLA